MKTTTTRHMQQLCDILAWSTGTVLVALIAVSLFGLPIRPQTAQKHSQPPALLAPRAQLVALPMTTAATVSPRLLAKF
jgi:hypothetical protein